MFADPQSVTIDAVANSLPRVSSGPNSGSFSLPDGTIRLTVSHNVNKRARHTARIDFQKLAADPLQPATNRPYSMSCYIVMDLPTFGFTVEEAKDVTDGLVAWLAASTGAAITKTLGGES